jgi:hypothetical protein
MNNRPTVYIAGKVTGLPVEDYTHTFNSAAGKFRNMGFHVVNPVEIVPTNTHWVKAMRLCIKELTQCDYIHMLPGWTNSKGARIERMIAYFLKIKRIRL